MMSEVSEVDVGVDDEQELNVPCRSPEPAVVDDRVPAREELDKHSNGEHEEVKEVPKNEQKTEVDEEIHQSETTQQNGNEDDQTNQQINNDFHPKCTIKPFVQPVQQQQQPEMARKQNQPEVDRKPIELKHIHTGDTKVRAKLRFEVVTARVIETGGKKHVAYTIMMKRVGHEPQPAVIERRYNDFCFIYECILRSFHPSILGDFQFPKKVLLGNFKAEVISERTDAFHKFLNLIANCNNLLYSDYFYSFLSSEEHNEAVSHIKLARYAEAVPLLETIFCVREKLLTIANVHVVLVLCELVACLSAESVGRNIEAFSYGLVAMRGFELVRGHPDVEPLRVSFLKLCSDLASDLGQDKKQFERQLSELRYAGVRLHNARPLLEVIRDRYIHRASHTSKIS